MLLVKTAYEISEFKKREGLHGNVPRCRNSVHSLAVAPVCVDEQYFMSLIEQAGNGIPSSRGRPSMLQKPESYSAMIAPVHEE
jgi:hypothetical protein